MTARKYMTDTSVASLKAKDKEYRVADIPGLYLRVQKSGKKIVANASET